MQYIALLDEVRAHKLLHLALSLALMRLLVTNLGRFIIALLVTISAPLSLASWCRSPAQAEVNCWNMSCSKTFVGYSAERVYVAGMF